MHIIQTPLFDFEAFISKKGNDRLVMVLEALPAEGVISTLEREHWTGRKGYSVRGMWSAVVAGLLQQCNSLAEVVRLLERDKDTRLVCGFSKDDVPGEDALGRFLKKPFRPRRSLGRQGGGPSRRSGKCIKGKQRDRYYWFGYKLHLVADALYELPVSFVLTPANESDTKQMEALLKKAGADKAETRPQAVIADKGYDSESNHKFIFSECKSAPIIPIREREDAQLTDIGNAKGTPLCDCGLEGQGWQLPQVSSVPTRWAQESASPGSSVPLPLTATY